MSQQLRMALECGVDFSLEAVVYPLDAIENQAILGDALGMLAKMEAEVAEPNWLGMRFKEAVSVVWSGLI